MVDVTEHDAHERELREAEQLLAMQIDDFKGEEIDPEDEPDLYLPLSAAKALHTALTAGQADIARLEADNAALRAEVERLKLNVDAQEALQDSAYRAGIKAGWNFCQDGDDEGYRRAMEGTEHIAELRRIRAARAALTEPTDEA